MDDARLRWGALAWLLTLQFFVVETIAELRHEGAYSRIDDVISDLGAGGSAAAPLMNASFVLQGVLITAGSLLLRSALPRPGGGLAAVLLPVAGAGVLVVGVVPLDADGQVHAAGAVAYLVGGSVGLLALARSLRPRSELLGSVLALLGVVSAAMTVFFLVGITRYLGEGGTERAAAYLLPLGLAVAGVGLWRLGRAPAEDAPAEDAPAEDAPAEDAPPEGPAPSRREVRAQERAAARAEAARRDAEREAALERYAADADGEDDHWAPSGRQQD